AVPAQPSGYRREMPGLSYKNNMKSWGPELCARRPDITMAMVDTFLTNMYGGARADFVYTVTRDFVRDCQTPILVLPDDVPGHPYAVAMETVHLAPNAQVSLYPWKDTPDKILLAVRHVRTFLRAHRPVAAAPAMAAAARGCVKTHAFNLREESPSRFPQSKEESRCGRDRKRAIEKIILPPCWLLSVFTQARPVAPDTPGLTRSLSRWPSGLPSGNDGDAASPAVRSGRRERS